MNCPHLTGDAVCSVCHDLYRALVLLDRAWLDGADDAGERDRLLARYPDRPRSLRPGQLPL